MIHKLYIFALFIVFLEICPNAANAQWQRTSGPEGGVISAIIPDGNILYAATGISVSGGFGNVGDVFRSSDLGKNWTSIGSDIPGNTAAYTLSINSTAIYCGTQNGLYRRMKTGTVWDSIAPASDRFLQIIASDTDLIAVTSFTGIFRSKDDGKTWTKINFGALQNVTTNAIDRNGSAIFLATQGQGIYVSNDNGLSWAAKSGIIKGEDLYVSALTHIGNKEFAGTLRGAFVSSDNGNTWDSCRNGLPDQFGPASFTSHSGSGDTLFAAVYSMRIFFSTDYGTNWNAMNTGIPPYSPTSSLAYCSGYLFTGVNTTGIMRARTDTRIWESATSGINNTSVSGMLQFGNTIFTGTNDNDFGLPWQSTDKGITWQPIDSMTDRGIVCYAEKDGTIFAGTFGDGLYTSNDGGVKWISRASVVPVATYVNTIAVTPTSVVAALTGTVGVVVTGDLGATWSSPLVASYTPINTVFYDSTSHTVFVGSGLGFFLSADDGATWVRPKTLMDSIDIYSYARVGNTLLAGCRFGIYSSNDNGATWSLADQSTKNIKFAALLTTGSSVYAAVHGGVLISNDNGASWQSFQTGLPKDADVLSLSTDGKALYAGTAGYGIWKAALPGTQSVTKDQANANQLRIIYSSDALIIRFTLEHNDHISLHLISETGEDLFTLNDEFLPAGIHDIRLSENIISKLVSRLYFIRLQTNEGIQSAKILIAKN